MTELSAPALAGWSTSAGVVLGVPAGVLAGWWALLLLAVAGVLWCLTVLARELLHHIAGAQDLGEALLPALELPEGFVPVPAGWSSSPARS